MTEGSSFSLTSFGRRRAFQPNEMDVLLEFTPFPAILIDPSFKSILSANNRMIELSLFTRTEIINQSLSALFHGWDPALMKSHIQDFEFDLAFVSPKNRLVSPEENLAVPLELARRDGTRLAIQVTLTRLAPKGKALLLSIEEIDEKKKQELERERNEKLWSRLVQISSTPLQEDFETALRSAVEIGTELCGAEALGVFEADGQSPGLQRCIFWGHEELFPEQLPAQDLAYLSKLTEWKVGKRPVCQLHRSARAHQVTTLITAPLGRPQAVIGLVAVAYYKETIPEKIHKIVEFLATILTNLLDQTILTLSSRQSHQNQMLMSIQQSMAESSMREGCIVLSSTYHVIRINAAAEAMLGYQEREVRGFLAYQAITGPTLDLQSMLPALSEKSAPESIHVNIYNRGGAIFPASMKVLPIKVEDHIERILILLEDLTEKNNIEAYNLRLQQHATLGEMTARFAHEVRNPINNISTGLDLMSVNLPSQDPNQEIISRLQHDCGRMDSMMNSILSYSRATNYVMEKVDIGQLIERLLERQHARMPKNIQYQIQVEPCCPLVEADPRGLEQVFTNLITNAIQAMSSAGGRLAIKIQNISTTENLPFVEITIADTGPGIPSENLQKIFEPFYTTKANGTGLGLAITKKVIQEHKGTMRVESFPGGTVFYIRLPLVIV